MQKRKYGKVNQLGPEIKAALGLQEMELSANVGAMPMPQNVTDRIIHYDLYITDGFINPTSGVWPPTGGDQTVAAGWFKNPPAPPAIAPSYSGPVYVWGFTDVDPNIATGAVPPFTFPNLFTVPPGAVPPTVVGGHTNPQVGNAKFPGPFLECKVGEYVFITVHNRGFFQYNQAVQDDHTLHLHGIHAQAPYDGFPESAGSYKEKLRYFWLEPWYIALGATTKARDAAWNAMTFAQQMTLLKANAPVIQDNFLDPMGAILSQFSSVAVEGAWPMSVGYTASAVLTDPRIWGTYAQMYGLDSTRGGYTVEQATQFTYYFHAMHPGTYMYHCHMFASEHVQMGMYGAIVVRPADYSATNKTVYGRKTNTDYDVENTIIISEFDPRWHRLIEGEIADPLVTGFRIADWKPELWFANGRTFPETILPFAWNTPGATPTTFGPPDSEPRYNVLVAMKTNQKFLIRYINMGYQEHPMHQHEWHTTIVGKDARPQNPMKEAFTILIGSGETYDTITLANPVYGVTDPAGSPLSSPHPAVLDAGGKPTIKWRQIFPIHDHDDYRVTTNDLYPGGAVIMQVVTDVPNTPAGTPTWFNPFLNNGLGGMDVIP